jgi:hypothetical protein
MTGASKIVSATIAAALISAILVSSFAVAKSYAQNPVQNLIGNVTKSGQSLIGNLTGLANKTGTTGGNKTTTPMAGNQTMLQFENGRLTGRVASIQVDANNKPEWIQAGIWMLRENLTGNATTAAGGNMTTTTTTKTTNATGGNLTTSTSNTTSVTGNATSIPGINPKTLSFIARFDMVHLNGTAMHQHQVSELKASQVTTDENGNPTIKGTVTVTMPTGPVKDVPITIKILRNAVIAMTIGPDKVSNHFGSNPIYGTVEHRR